MKPFEQIVTEQGPTVLRVCRAVVGPDDAEDAWSETFLAAMRAYPDLPEDSNVEAWLVTVAHRKAIDQHRARARRAVPVDPVAEVGAPHGADAAEHAQAVVDRRDLWDAIAALPDTQRQAIAYHHLGGLPYAEVAAILGNTEAAARRAAADGMKRLRAAYRRDRETTRSETG